MIDGKGTLHGEIQDQEPVPLHKAGSRTLGGQEQAACLCLDVQARTGGLRSALSGSVPCQEVPSSARRRSRRERGVRGFHRMVRMFADQLCGPHGSVVFDETAFRASSGGAGIVDPALAPTVRSNG